MKPSSSARADTRSRLLAAGLALAPKVGLRGLTVRGVARRAGVNLGSFVHHFGTRHAYLEALIEHWYGPLFAQMQVEAQQGRTAHQRLQALLLSLGAFVLAQREFIAHVLMDAAAGERAARAFVGSLAGRHPALVLAALAQAQRERSVRKAPPLRQMLFLFGAIGAPTLLLGGAGLRDMLPRELAVSLREVAVDPAALAERVQWALQGIST